MTMLSYDTLTKTDCAGLVLVLLDLEDKQFTLRLVTCYFRKQNQTFNISSNFPVISCCYSNCISHYSLVDTSLIIHNNGFIQHTY